MEELKACPFCGEELKLVTEQSGAWYVRCGNCQTFGPSATEEQEAIDAWNKRS